MTTKRVGFIGLGSMGKPMAIQLLKRGLDTTVFDIKPEPAGELRTLGARVAVSPKDLAQASDFIVTMVQDTNQTKQIIFGREGLWEEIRSGTTLIIMSTIDPQFVRDLCRKAHDNGIAVLDAPVSGGVKAAEEGSLSIMVGGEQEVFEKCRPLFKAMGGNIIHVGDIGSGLVAKLVNNLILAVNIMGTVEGLTLGVAAGVSSERLIEVISASSGNSRAVERWAYYDRRLREYKENPHRGCSMLYKDAGIALDFARAIDVRLPLLALMSNLDIDNLQSAATQDP